MSKGDNVMPGEIRNYGCPSEFTMAQTIRLGKNIFVLSLRKEFIYILISFMKIDP